MYNELKVGDKVTVRGYEGEVVQWLDDRCFIHFGQVQHDVCKEIFHGKLQKRFQEEILKYSEGGDFPFCRTLSDLTKFVNAINEIDMETNTPLALHGAILGLQKKEDVKSPQRYTKAQLLSGNFCIQCDTKEQWEKLCKWIGAPEFVSYWMGKAIYLYTNNGEYFTWDNISNMLDERGGNRNDIIPFSAIDFSETPVERKISHYVCPKDIPKLDFKSSDVFYMEVSGYFISKRTGTTITTKVAKELIRAFFTPVYEPLVKTFPNGKITIEGNVSQEELATIKI